MRIPDRYQAGDWNCSLDTPGNNGYEVPYKGGYHVAAPQDVGYDLRSRMCMMMEDWGIKVKYHHHEVGGPGQMEIEVELADMPEMADNTMIIKYIIKNMAAQEGKTATLYAQAYLSGGRQRDACTYAASEGRKTAVL